MLNYPDCLLTHYLQWKTVSALAKVALFTPDPRAKVQTIVDLLYPAAWLSEAPSNPKLAKYKTNREYATYVSWGNTTSV